MRYDLDLDFKGLCNIGLYRMEGLAFCGGEMSNAFCIVYIICNRENWWKSLSVGSYWCLCCMTLSSDTPERSK